ncbi:hypothetical protein [Roseimicrobium gellanilyticum]|nr:hypothetical protein [Roseimicrobium gellanilyticum]
MTRADLHEAFVSAFHEGETPVPVEAADIQAEVRSLIPQAINYQP